MLIVVKFEHDCVDYHIPAGIYLFKVNNRNTRAMCKIWPKLTIKTRERRQWRCSGVFILNFDQISRIVPVFPLLTSNKQMSSGIPHNFYRSVDSLLWPSIRNKTVPRWHQGIIKFQVGFSGLSVINSMLQLAKSHQVSSRY